MSNRVIQSDSPAKGLPVEPIKSQESHSCCLSKVASEVAALFKSKLATIKSCWYETPKVLKFLPLPVVGTIIHLVFRAAKKRFTSSSAPDEPTSEILIRKAEKTSSAEPISNLFALINTLVEGLDKNLPDAIEAAKCAAVIVANKATEEGEKEAEAIFAAANANFLAIDGAYSAAEIIKEVAKEELSNTLVDNNVRYLGNIRDEANKRLSAAVKEAFQNATVVTQGHLPKTLIRKAEGSAARVKKRVYHLIDDAFAKGLDKFALTHIYATQAAEEAADIHPDDADPTRTRIDAAASTAKAAFLAIETAYRVAASINSFIEREIDEREPASNFAKYTNYTLDDTVRSLDYIKGSYLRMRDRLAAATEAHNKARRLSRMSLLLIRNRLMLL